MLNKLLRFLRRYEMVQPGDGITCAVSGGADSMAMLWGLYLLQEKLHIQVAAAHFNHGLRGAESDRDERFVHDFCGRHDIPFFCGRGDVLPGKKGLEAAARDARYAYLRTLPGKIATAHTADDNAETVLMHLVRGTGLRGLGAIAPVNGNLIRPMLTVTRDEVLAFLRENHIPYVEDSSNHSDAFLRNRLRHHVVPLLKQENPRLAENLSRMALELREDERALEAVTQAGTELSVSALRAMDSALCARTLGAFLKNCGVREPERSHVELAYALVRSDNPSAKASFPGGVTVCRDYDRLTPAAEKKLRRPVVLKVPGITELPDWGLRVICEETDRRVFCYDCFTVCPQGEIVVRGRLPGDAICLSGGTKTLKKLLIDRKIPLPRRDAVAVFADDMGVIAVEGIGADVNRIRNAGICIQIIKL